MKVKLVSTLSALLIMAVALTAAFALPRSQKLMQKSSSVSTVSAKKVTGYIVKEYHGKVGIFLTGKNTPQQILDVYVSSLPQPDQGELKTGISVATQQKLLEMIENYTS
ncbi:MAG TPA: hypothetical protein VHR42_06555 [Clostridia bacterium]|nr:hypothetical protein [Clostridia bacterium]